MSLRATGVLALLSAVALPAVSPSPSAQGASGPDLEYAFEGIYDPFPMVRVSLTLANGAPRTSFRLQEHWASVKETRSAVHGVRATSADGSWLDVRETEPNTWVVEHEPGVRFEVAYMLVAPEQERISDDPKSFYRVQVRDDLFFMAGHVGLMRPLHLDREEVLDIGVAWRGFADMGFTALSSFSAEQDRFTARTTLNRFLHSLFMAGNIRHHRLEVRGGPVHVGIYGTDWKFTDEDFLGLTAEIMELERGFFDDFEQPYYLITTLLGRR